ncbi:GNAT family N-acetyltransferase [Sediminibacillus albus]|uniref:Ribosomal-protein-serine acetyltransferase n=1 Tax=Sediminibacillus albus TaxID=407036 RepID=A0A1G9CCF3_9BACI|nr:GNAT family protein [Sediminibacillus albus]SDK49320.1 ribosomal-protein-serine acetyltransferase [Sediminibacillus albus]
MFTYKVDEEMELKLIELGDAEQVFELTDSSRESLRTFLRWVDGTSKPEDTKEFIQAGLRSFAENKSMTTVILYKNEIAGVAGYHEINWTNKSVSIGYWLGQKYQGKGIMLRAVRALTNYAFNRLALNRVEIRAAAENVKSRAIPEKLNFKEEGCIRQAEWLYDHYVDHVVYGMLAEEWQEKH